MVAITVVGQIPSFRFEQHSIAWCSEIARTIDQTKHVIFVDTDNKDFFANALSSGLNLAPRIQQPNSTLHSTVMYVQWERTSRVHDLLSLYE